MSAPLGCCVPCSTPELVVVPGTPGSTGPMGPPGMAYLIDYNPEGVLFAAAGCLAWDAAGNLWGKTTAVGLNTGWQQIITA